MSRTLCTVLALFVVLSATTALADSPSAYGVASHASMRGSLSGAPKISPIAYFSEREGFGPIENMSRESLLLERNRLEDQRPGIGGPLALIITGGVLTLTGLLVAVDFVGYLAAGVIAGVVIALIGGALLTVGLVLLFTRMPARRDYGERLDAVNRRLDMMDHGAQPNMDPYYPPPPPPGMAPPPPPPPDASWNAPDTSILVASF